MKTRKILFALLPFIGFSLSGAFAQSAASSSRDLGLDTTTYVAPPPAEEETPQEPDYDFLPESIAQLVWDGKDEEAIAAFKEYKKSIRKQGAFTSLYLEYQLYDMLAYSVPGNSLYGQARANLFKKLGSKYDDRPQVIAFAITDTTTPEQIIEIATRMIEADSTYRPAYELRGRALYQLGKIKEACPDLEKAPNRDLMPEYWPCLGIGVE